MAISPFTGTDRGLLRSVLGPWSPVPKCEAPVSGRTHFHGTYVHRSEDVCYRVQLSLHLLSKAIVFCENCTKLHSFACRTSAVSSGRGLYPDGHSPSSVTTRTLLFEPHVPQRKRCNTARFIPLFGRIDKKLGLPSSSRPTPKNSTQLY